MRDELAEETRPRLRAFAPRAQRAQRARTTRTERARTAHTQRARTARTPGGGLLVAILALLAIDAASASAQEVSRQQMQGLDEQVQEVKSEVLSIAAELGRLEEKLLYPSSTQVSIFVSLAGGEGFRLDSLQIQLDGEPVARHVYRFEELEALRKGGVQRIYTGNVGSGEHRLEVSLVGKRAGEDVASRESFSFRKDVEPKLIGLTLEGDASGAPGIRLGDR